MNDWWQIAFAGACLTALAMLAIGIWIGYQAGLDAAADAEAEARFAAVPGGRHHQGEPRRMPAAPKAASESTAPLFARFEAEVAPGGQPPLKALVDPARAHRPGRVTDVIEGWEAETDRFIAAMRQ